MRLKQNSIIPGFGLTLGFTLFYTSLLVLIPLAALVVNASGLSWTDFWTTVSSEREIRSYCLSFGAAFIAALINVVFGVIVAWVLVRYRFPGRSLIDALVDLPFALPTAVAGIALCTLYGPHGWLGSRLEDFGIKVAYTPLGVTVALIFIGMPFVVRTVQPVLEELGKDVEEAAASLGANRWQTILRIIAPELWPAVLTGFALAFARGVGEYGSVVFISGNLGYKTEITPLLIVQRLENGSTNEASAIAVVMLTASFLILFFINLLQRWITRRSAT